MSLTSLGDVHPLDILAQDRIFPPARIHFVTNDQFRAGLGQKSPDDALDGGWVEGGCDLGADFDWGASARSAEFRMTRVE
jgi:hypothetical protein